MAPEGISIRSPWLAIMITVPCNTKVSAIIYYFS